LAEGLGLISVFIKMFGGTDTREGRAETSRKNVMRMFASYGDVLKEKYKSLSRQSSELNFFKFRHLCIVTSVEGH